MKTPETKSRRSVRMKETLPSVVVPTGAPEKLEDPTEPELYKVSENLLGVEVEKTEVTSEPQVVALQNADYILSPRRKVSMLNEHTQSECSDCRVQIGSEKVPIEDEDEEPVGLRLVSSQNGPAEAPDAPHIQAEEREAAIKRRIADLEREITTLKDGVRQYPAAIMPPVRSNGTRHNIRTFCEEQLLKNDPPLTYKQILQVVRNSIPGIRTSIKCLRWYANQLRQQGVHVPLRPRTPILFDTKAAGFEV